MEKGSTLAIFNIKSSSTDQMYDFNYIAIVHAGRFIFRFSHQTVVDFHHKMRKTEIFESENFTDCQGIPGKVIRIIIEDYIHISIDCLYNNYVKSSLIVQRSVW